MDGWSRFALYLAVMIDVARLVCKPVLKSIRFFRLQPAAVHLQVVLTHPPVSLALLRRALSGRYSDDWIFDFQGARGNNSSTPSLLSRVREGVENQIFILLFLTLLEAFSKSYAGACSPLSVKA